MKKHLATGLVILLPLTVTFGIVIFIVNFLTKPFMGFVTKILSHTRASNIGFFFLSSDQVIKYGSQLLILISLFLITVGLGFLARGFFIKGLIRLGDKILHRIPIVNKVYKTSQDIIQNLFVTDKNSFKQVVMAPFPNENSYCIGLVSRNSPYMCNDELKADLVSVFIPTTPNPTTGFLLMIKREDLVFIDMKTEDAIKYIVSCGVVLPENPNKAEA